MYSSGKMTYIISFLVVITLCHWSYATDCGHFSADITCMCLNSSVSCTGFNNINFDITVVISNISLQHYSSSALDSLLVNIEGLDFPSNATFADMNLKNLKLGVGLQKLDEDIFAGLNTTLVQLNLQHNNFENVPYNALHFLRNLEYLDLSYNNIVSLSERDFKGLEKLKILKIKHNQITFTINAFVFLENLEYLYLDFNYLKTITDGEFKNLQKLKHLSVSSNLIREIQPGSIKDLNSLQTLIIDNNKISSFARIDISSKSLEKFSASNCSIQGILVAETLKNLPNLVYLDLSLNKLKEIQPYALSKLSKLETLNISSNHIETMRDHAFSAVSNLKELNMDDNTLSVIEKFGFVNLTKLRLLNLNRNKLEGFFCTYTSDLWALERLELEENLIQAVHPGTFMLSPYLRILKIGGNVFDCKTTCPAIYFSSYLQNNTLLEKMDVDAVLCHTPLSLQGERLVDVHFTPLVCPDNNLLGSNPCQSSEDEYYDEYEYDDTTTAAEFESTSTKESTVTTVTSTEDTTATTVTSKDDTTTTTVMSTEYATVTTVTSAEDTTVTLLASTEDTTATTVTSAEDTTVSTVTSTEDTTATTVMSTKDTTVSTVTSVEDTTVTLLASTEDMAITALTSSTAFSAEMTDSEVVETTSIRPNATESTNESSIFVFVQTDSSSSLSDLERTTNDITSDITDTIKYSLLTTDLSLSTTPVDFSSQLSYDSTIKLTTENLLFSTVKTTTLPTTSNFLTSVFPINGTGASFVSGSTTVALTDVDDMTEVSSVSDKTDTPSFHTSQHSKGTTVYKTSTFTTAKIFTSYKPFNFTYLNMLNLNATSILVQWRVNRKEPSFACHLKLSVVTDSTNHTAATFICSDDSFIVKKIKQDVMYEICLQSYHITYGVNTICHHIYYPSHEFSSSKSTDSATSSLSVMVLIGLLIIVICIVLLLAARRVFRKRHGTDHYNVSEEERKVEKRNYQRQSGQTVRYSYTENETFFA